MNDKKLTRNIFGMNPIIRDLRTALIVADEIGMKGSGLTGIMLHAIVKSGGLTLEQVKSEFGEDVANISKYLVKTSELYAKSSAIASENYQKLQLTFAEEMRVSLIMIAACMILMRHINITYARASSLNVADESEFLN